MKIGNLSSGLRAFLGLLLIAVLAGCSNSPVQDPLWFLHPNGPIARASIYYLVVDVLLLLIIIVPATALVIWTFWRYRRGGGGEYDPTYNHSIPIEVIVWGIPLLLVAVLSYFSYQGVKDVEPYSPQALDSVTAKNGGQKPLHIDVISTDWQWLFIYPDQHVALANRLVVPTGRKIEMDLTSTTVTNDFYVLKVVNQIYMMPGMRTKHNFYVERPGTYQGFSTEFSGPGFSWMNYKMQVVKPKQFDQWVQRAQASGNRMHWQQFLQFAQPTINTGNAWKMYSDVEPNLLRKTIHAVNTGQLNIKWPMRFSEEMTSPEFEQRFGTGDAESSPDGTTADEPQNTPDR
ncbi:ubiquinol oxidase subunit II [Salinisphaera sp. Q1T1-3]|uniref:ubiquinol oxidase subunit II n=1 Tax=Salinisphaera sp. Q1T1-3 TaxID=2321229 RepID=UPI000E73B15A|nr:ubiquinol oxidase subunit II [Salinisphaera sp. Q1T1-3]RJS91280.1 ubiquinol oxidase subunit II [Salinisphaera sp. Q1T1-3]